MTDVTIPQLASILNKYNLRLVSLEKRIGELEGENAHLKRFKRPSVEEIEAYLKEKNYNTFDAKGFWLGKESNGWHGVKSWKKTVDNWVHHGFCSKPASRETKSVQEMFGNT